MPQLDAVTFLSQVFWLTIFFVGYYLIGLNYILPTLSGRLKARSKKVALGKGRVSGFDGERIAALSVYDTAVAASSSWVSGNVTNIVSQSEAWRQEQGRTADAGVLRKSNESYLKALSSSAALVPLVQKATA